MSELAKKLKYRRSIATLMKETRPNTKLFMEMMNLLAPTQEELLCDRLRILERQLCIYNRKLEEGLERNRMSVIQRRARELFFFNRYLTYPVRGVQYGFLSRREMTKRDSILAATREITEQVQGAFLTTQMPDNVALALNNVINTLRS